MDEMHTFILDAIHAQLQYGCFDYSLFRRVGHLNENYMYDLNS